MRKMLLGLILSCMMVFGFSNVTYAADTTAPEIVNANFVTTSTEKPGVIQLELDIVEEESGVARIEISLAGNTNSQSRSLSNFIYYTDQFSGKVIVDFEVPQNQASGIYYISEIRIYDNLGNFTKYFGVQFGYMKDGEYVTSDSFYIVEGEKTYLPSCDVDSQNPVIDENTKKCYMGNNAFVTILSNGDETAPLINHITVLTPDVAKGEDFRLKFNVTEEGSGVATIRIEFVTYQGKRDFTFSDTCENVNLLGGTTDIEASFSTSKSVEKVVGGEYYIREITIIDQEGNQRNYIHFSTYESPEYFQDDNGPYIADNANADNRCYIVGGQTIQLVGQGDEIAPLIKSITIHDKEVIKPSEMYITFDIVEEDEIQEINLSLYAIKDGEEMQTSMGLFVPSSDYKNISTGQHKLKFVVPALASSAEYYISNIRIRDTAGNETMYLNENMVGEKKNHYRMDEYGAYLYPDYDEETRCYIEDGATITIKDEFEVGLDSNLNNPNLLNQIQSMEKGKAAKILLVSNDMNQEYVCKKEVFDIIKGKDKTLIFYTDSYQWIFNGKDIVNETKDIALRINFETHQTFDVNNQVIAQENRIIFHDNGVLPGKANVRMIADYTRSMGETIYLYYKNEEDNQYELEEDSSIKRVDYSNSFWCYFDISHNSTFVISDQHLDKQNIDKNIKVNKIKLSGISKKIAAGKKIRLTAQITPSNAINQEVTWKSSNKKFATVSSRGVVTTKKEGAGKTVKISAVAQDGSGVKATYKITIMKNAVKSVKLKATKKTVKAGKTVAIKATVKTNGKNANKTLQWTTSNSKYATVTSKGKVKTKKAGKGKKVKITAMATDGTGKKATVTIKLK